ncbi:MAG: hypothetical protein D6732_12580 [Methanobacteriota archaeon]|nr:MAG: hypothetical protein D6732_12580 [Euryarchaeota archaeon]
METDMKPTIVISAFEREKSLARLLKSVAKALTGDEPIKIVVGRKEGNENVRRIANNFVENFPNSEVVHPHAKMSLVDQFLFIGDLTKDEKSIILLEDDLMVSDSFYDFASSALDFFKKDTKVGGICLNSLSFNGYTKLPFYPIDDGSDIFFAQIPFYHGQAFTKSMWSDFRRWLDKFDGHLNHPSLPPVFRNFPSDEWFPTMTQFLLEKDKFFAFPRISFAVNFGEPGRHFRKPTEMFQSPLAHFRHEFRFKKFHDSRSVYDVHQELLPKILAPSLGISQAHQLVVDLYGSKHQYFLQSAELLLTTKPVHKSEVTFGSAMRPLEENIFNEVHGTFITLTNTDQLKKHPFVAHIQFAKLLYYHYPMHGINYGKRFKSAVLHRIFS